MIRKDAEWVEILDERILEYLRDNSSTCLSTLIVAKGVRGSKEKIQRRCERLCKIDAIMKEGEQFKITVLGILYLKGEIGADDLSRELQVYTHPAIFEELEVQIHDNRLSQRVSGCEVSATALRD